MSHSSPPPAKLTREAPFAYGLGHRTRPNTIQPTHSNLIFMNSQTCKIDSNTSLRTAVVKSIIFFATDADADPRIWQLIHHAYSTRLRVLMYLYVLPIPSPAAQTPTQHAAFASSRLVSPCLENMAIRRRFLLACS